MVSYKKYTFISLSFILIFLKLSSQNEIKSIIYSDLILLNKLYDGQLIQNQQSRTFINEKGDTIINVKYFEDMMMDYTNLKIVSIDSVFNFYFIKVKFDLIPTVKFFDLFNNLFSYVLFKDENKFRKINGFLTSEILYIQKSDIKMILSNSNMEFNTYRLKQKKIEDLVSKRNGEEIRKYLNVSVLKGIALQNKYICYYPYISSPIGW